MLQMLAMHEFDALRGNLDLLVHLQALLSERSVTRAAERLHLSQPALSRSLARLRDLFQDRLLERSGDRMLLTPRAEALEAPLRALLCSAADLVRPAAFDPASAERTFHGVLPDVLATALLPPLLGRLRERAPGCRLRLHPWQPTADADGLDFVITSHPEFYPRLRMEPLYEDADVLAFRSPPPAEASILDLPHVAVTPAGHSADPVDVWLATHGLRRAIAVTVPHYLLAAQLLAAGDFVAVLPSRLVRALDLRYAEIDLPQPPDRMWLLYPPAHAGDPASVWLRALFAEVARSGPA